MRHVITGANAATDPWPISEKNTVPPLSAKERESRINVRNKRDYETVRMRREDGMGIIMGRKIILIEKHDS